MPGLWPVTTNTLSTPWQRLLQRGAVGQFGDRDLGVGAQHLARFVRIANDAHRVLPECL